MSRVRVGYLMVWLCLGLVLGFVVGVKFEYLQLRRVIDGDTVVVKNWRDGLEWRVRFVGIDAPALKECYGEAAKGLLEKYLGNGKLRFERYGYDGYGRILAKVYVNGKDVQEMMVATGAARAYDAKDVHDEVKPESGYFGYLSKVQEEIRKTKWGIWSDLCVLK